MAASATALDPQLVELLQGALEKHGADVLLRAWTLAEPLLPVAVLMEDVRKITEVAQAHSITRPQFDDAIALLGYLRASEDPHQAWLAAEIVRRHCAHKGHFFAAMMAAYKMPDEPKEEGDGQSAPQDHRLP